MVQNADVIKIFLNQFIRINQLGGELPSVNIRFKPIKQLNKGVNSDYTLI